MALSMMASGDKWRNWKEGLGEKRRAVVVGGGIAGLAVAYYLRKHGLAVTVLERDNRVGGVMRTSFEEERYLLEHGPNAFLASADALVKLARELSIDSQIISSAVTSRDRFVVRGGRLERLPLSPKTFLGSRALSFSGKLRLLMEPWVKSRSSDDESITSFVSRRAGREVLEALVDPFVSGVYAGDPSLLSMASTFPKLVKMEEEYGSIVKGMFKRKQGMGNAAHHTNSVAREGGGLFSFRWGMGTLPARLEEVLRSDIQQQISIESVERLPDGTPFVRVEAPRRTIEADAVVLATPAWMSARLLAPLIPGIIAPLMGIPYVPIAVVHTAFSAKTINHPLAGFGFLVPRREGIRLLGSIWSSSLFSGRSPAGEVLLTNYIGGATDPRIVELEDHEIIAHVMSGLEATIGLRGEPTFVHIRRLGQAIPQYAMGHGQRLQEIERQLNGVGGIFATGNYFSGVSVAETIEHARKTADRVLTYLGVWSPRKGES